MKKTILLSAITLALAGCDGVYDDYKAGDANARGSAYLSGGVLVGDTLSVEIRDDDGVKADSASYTWMADGSVITGATGATYTLTNAEAGATIKVSVAYTDNNGTREELETYPSGTVVANQQGSLALSGEARVAQTLTAVLADADGFDPSEVTFTWLADDVEISGATTDSYTLTPAEEGAVVSVTAAYTDDVGFVETHTASSTAVTYPDTAGTLSLSKETPTVGDTLSATVMDVDGLSGATYTYQWMVGGVEVSTNATYVVAAEGDVVTANVTYTDDRGFTTTISAASNPAAGAAVQSPGELTISGTVPYIAGATLLTANIADQNGTDGVVISYQWKADGTDISGATAETYTPVADDAGKTISVTAVYTDSDGFAEDLSEDGSGMVYTAVVNNEVELITALATQADGDYIGFNTATYADMAPVELTTATSLVAVEGQSPELSGEVCIHVAETADGVTLSGFTLSDIEITSGAGSTAGDACIQEKASLVLEGDNLVLSQNDFEGEAAPVNGYNFVSLKGDGALVERNTFAGINSSNGKDGTFLKVSSAAMDPVVQYNLFKDMTFDALDGDESDTDTSAFAIQVGSSTGTSSNTVANMTIQYNRFQDILGGRRLMRVQTSGATIKGNTVVDSYGAISLEDGSHNTVTENIILRNTTDVTLSDGTTTSGIALDEDLAAGVVMTWFGHTVTNNYMGGFQTGDKDEGGIVFSVNELSQGTGGVPNSGNQALVDDASADYTLTVANNTILNSMQSIVFSTEIGSKVPVGDCDEMVQGTHALYDMALNKFKVNFDSNLVINGLNSGVNTTATKVGKYLDNVVNTSDHVIEYDCDILDRTNSVFTNNSGFSDSYASGDAYKTSDGHPGEAFWQSIRSGNGDTNGNGAFDSDSAWDQTNPTNPSSKDHAEIAVLANGLIEGSGDEAGRGADADTLYFIEESDVGVGSTWTRN